MSATAKRMVVLGLDGLSFTTAKALGEAGVMPNLHRLLVQGDARPMDTELPALSAVCWTSFFTGANPGQHRIYGFYECQVDAYGLWTQNLKDVKVPALWDYAQAAGLRSVIVNLPGTFPAQPINGVMVSGFIAPDWEQSIYPKMFAPVLEKAGYKLDVECAEVGNEPEKFLAACETAIRARGRAMSTLLRHEPCDLFVGVFTECDRIQHYFFDALEDAHHPLRRNVLRSFQILDEEFGRCLAAVRDEDDLLVLADHGFCRVQLEIQLNRWLTDNGYFRLKENKPGATLADMDMQASRAFSLDPGRIYLNVAGRQSEGCVPARERRRLAEEIAGALEKMEIRVPWSARPIRPIQKAWLREDLYKGPFVHLAPDIVAVTPEGLDLKSRFEPGGLTGLRNFTGMHTYGNALCFRRGTKLPKSKLRIRDLAPLILDSLDLSKTP